MWRIFLFLVLIFSFVPILSAKPVSSRSVNIEPGKLRPGQFIWKGNTVLSGSMAALVSLPEQKIYLYRNGIVIAISTISTGRGKRNTPTGVFTVLAKERFHRSKKYHNAPMPYTQWLTLDGVAMHAGKLPGYPASHGCIRLPTPFARLLFKSSSVGMRVVVTHQQSTEVELTTLFAENGKEQQTIKIAVSDNKSIQAELSPPIETSAEIKTLDAEIEKTLAKLNKIQKEVAIIEKERL